jgi:hypothetical protein
LAFGKDHVTGEVAKTLADGARDKSKEEGTGKEHTSSATSGSLKRQRSGDSFISMMAKKLYKFTKAIRAEAPTWPISKEIFSTLEEIYGLDEDTFLDLFGILTGDACKYDSLLALPVILRKRWLLKQLKK